MKVICPHCELKGTADDALVEKKVRCPQCQKVFRMIEANILSTVTTSQEIAAVYLPGSAVPVGLDQPVPREISASRLVQAQEKIPAPELGTCSVCGFTLSHAYLEENEAKLYCRICLPA